MDTQTPGREGIGKDVRIAVVHAHHLTREVIAAALQHELGVQAVAFSCVEQVLESSMNYDVFVVYSDFGHGKMDQSSGCMWLKQIKPEALVIPITHRRFFDRRGHPPGADLVEFASEGDVKSVVRLIEKKLKDKI